MASRKRHAPGASPQGQQQAGAQSSAYPQQTGNIGQDQYLNGWEGTNMSADLTHQLQNVAFGDPTLFDYNNLGAAPGPSGHSRVVSLDGLKENSAPNATPNAGTMVRRNANQQLLARAPTSWETFNGSQQGNWEEAQDEDGQLEQKALMARKDAQSKRKQIPPFVQKLSSFLDDNKNTTLIRWSDDGNSFIVIDEDEFARTLIPELFKHNNYASFVRQLNMYGFHKKVGLSDNSMKASETKAKAPSEYFNKYFKRGRPELLWLIQKPKNPTAGPKRKRDEEGKQGESDEERKFLPETGGGVGYDNDLAVRGTPEMAMIPRTEYNSLRSEVKALQQQQKVISTFLAQIRRQNEQLYQQATAFQTLHDRHENSINAILTFLATFYSRTNGSSPPNLAEVFATLTPQQQQPHGNVVDVDDFVEDKPFKATAPLQRQTKRPLALLPAPAVKDGLGDTGRATTLSPSNRSASGTFATTPQPRNFASPATQARNVPGPSNPRAQQPRSGLSREAGQPLVDIPSPQDTSTIPQNDEIISAIQNANASAGQSASQAPQFDFPAALASYQAQDGNSPLTPEQRNTMLSLMANNASAASPNSALAQNTNNAVNNPQAPPMPDMSQFEANQAQLDLLEKISQDTDSRVQILQNRLQPLSPSGTIPGLETSYFDNAVLGDPGHYDLDLDNYVQNDDFFPSTTNGDVGGAGDINLPDLNFDELTGANTNLSANLNMENQAGGEEDLLGFDGANDSVGAGSRIESVSSEAPSPATVEDAPEDDELHRPSPKRMKK